MRRLVALVLVAGCASAGAPPGGAERHTPPEIVSITPDSAATNIKDKVVEFKFDEVVSDRSAGAGGMLDNLFLVSPRTGAVDVAWHRTRITIRPKRGFLPNTAYTVTMLPGLVDLRGNSRKDTRSVVFSTGADFPPYSIPGRVFDWAAQRPVAGAFIEAVSKADTNVAYLAATDTSGQFDVGPLPSGAYLVRALMDQNGNRKLDRNEKWDTLSTGATLPRRFIELDAIERDSLPPNFEGVTIIDSVTFRASFDKPLDPRLPLQPALLRIQRADSTEIQIARVQWASTYDATRQAILNDSLHRADSTRTAGRGGAPPPPAPVTTPGGTRLTPPQAKPQAPPPDRAIVVSVLPATPMIPGSYRLTAKGFRNLVGHASDIGRTFVVPKPTPRDTTKKNPADTTKRAPGDTTRPPAARPPPLR